MDECVGAWVRGWVFYVGLCACVCACVCVLKRTGSKEIKSETLTAGREERVSG
jgi:hypothetical protein